MTSLRLEDFLSRALRRRDDGLTPAQAAAFDHEFATGLGKAPESSPERTSRMEMLASKIEPQVWQRPASRV